MQIRTFPDPVLRQKASEVVTFDAALGQLMEDMAQTMYFGDGVGLAAPQVGVLKRVIVADVTEERRTPLAIANPVITAAEGETSFQEGCLSIPDYRDMVSRAERVTVEGRDRHGAPVKIEAAGLLAVCLQHEIDHLDGVLFIDRLSRLKREMFKRWLKKRA